MRAPSYLAWIRTLPCCVCQAPAPSDPHHVKTRATGGSDYDTVPLCRSCHSRCHETGLKTFSTTHGLWTKGRRLVAQYEALQGSDDPAAAVVRARAHHLAALYTAGVEGLG